MILDGSTVLNLASFVHTWMPPQGEQLVHENITKNLIGEIYSVSFHSFTNCNSIC